LAVFTKKPLMYFTSWQIWYTHHLSFENKHYIKQCLCCRLWLVFATFNIEEDTFFVFIYQTIFDVYRSKSNIFTIYWAVCNVDHCFYN